MKLARATEKDFRRFWSINNCVQLRAIAQSELRATRCEKVILGRLKQLGSGFTRVVGGCEVLIENCCDPEKDYYDFSPKPKAALESLDNGSSG